MLTSHTGDPTKGNVYYNNECIHLAVCNVALHLARLGRYHQSGSVVKFAAAHYSHFQQHSHLWKITDLHVAFYRSLWLAQWDRAEQIVSQMAVFDSVDSLCKRAQLLLCKGDCYHGSSVLDVLDRQLTSSSSAGAADGDGHASNSGWQLSRKLSLQIKSYALRSVMLCAQRDFAEALEYVSRALSMCTMHHMKLQTSLISLQLADIQVIIMIIS